MGGNDAVSHPPPNDVVPAEELDDDQEEDYDDDDLVGSSNSLLDRVKLADSPILLLVYFHEAFRAEIAGLRRAVADAAERGNHAPDFVFELLRRFEFLKLACKYHCVAEDEVIFLALDVHVRNVACTYSLEHKSIDGLFDSIFFRLNAMLELENSRNVSTKPFRELMLCIGTIQSFISKHMLKEEKQVFPLLVEHIPMKEQASLVWQFMCSVPIVLLEDMFPWMLSFLSAQQQLDVTNCIRDIVPEEKSLQEVILSWLGTNYRDTETKNSHVSDMKTLLKSYSCRRFFSQCWSSTTSFTSDVTHNPLDGLQLWHSAINKDLTSLLSELSQAKKSSSFSNLDNIIIQLKFLADIITFYSNALERLFWPVLNQLVHGHMAPSVAEAFPSESHIERLQMLLYHTAQHHANPSEFVDKLCWELDSFVVEISKQFSFHEAEVFPVISRNCSRETQRRILYVSVHMMPLGLLRCVITWFSTHLSEEECRFVLNTIKQEEAFGDGNSLASLLYEWLRAGCSGKTSVEKFGNNLQQMFKSRRPFLSEQNKDSVARASSSETDTKNREKPDTSRLQILQSTTRSKSCLLQCSSTYGQTSRKCETPYSSVINLHIYFPETIKIYHPFSEILGGETASGSALIDPKPMDFIFYFHKALKADLEYLVFGSLQLAHNAGFLDEFRRRFDLIQFLYQIHSDAEDEVAFPALEQMGKVVNISHSYSLDHKLEAEHFESVSHILDKLSELKKSSLVEADSDARMRRHNHLCLRLYQKCESMHKLLTDHIHREEVELWPLFRECFSTKEQERIVGSIPGRTKAEMLQEMIPWLMGSLTQEEQHTMMSLWRQVTRHTMFDEWLREWWEGSQILPGAAAAAEEARINTPSLAAATDPLEIVFDYIAQTSTPEGEANPRREEVRTQERDGSHSHSQRNVDDKAKDSDFDPYGFGLVGHRRSRAEPENAACEVKPGAFLEAAQKSKHHDLLMKMSQEDLEAVILKVTSDPSLDSQKKSYIIQNLLVSRWIVRHHSQSIVSSDEQEFPGKHPSYKDPVKGIFGCEHYKRNCKLVAPCCNQLYTCLKCHDEITDHVIDRKSVKEMMCMKCLKIQPIGQTCSTPSCEKFSMARYYCRICKIFEDERVIYHCPYCNLCRLGKGLGIDYFHCMNCNACMSRTLMFVHVCREKCLMDNCPICHEDLFTSTLPVKALQCGHLMHSKCFEAYTCTNYTCPICGKSLGDMQVYFQMLDALLAEDQIPEEYAGQAQVILCSDCGKRGEASFHWRYHKCPLCGSYNTRVL